MWAVTIFFLTLIPYFQTSSFAFINLDDYASVSNNVGVKNGLTIKGIKWAFTDLNYGAIWMPLTWISYMGDVSLWGINAPAMHLENALIHSADAVVLFILLLQLLKRIFLSQSPQARIMFIAALATLFWSLHPLRVEPVAWIASRKDVLSVFWELVALIFWVKSLASSDLRPLTSDLRSAFFRVMSLLCFACACMCKPTAMTFPILAGLLEFLIRRHIRWDDYTVPFLGALGVAWLAQYAQASGGATVALAHVPLLGRLLNAVAAFGIYCWQTLFPNQITAAHVHKWPSQPLFLVPGLVICAVYGAGLMILFWRSGACRVLLAELPTKIRERLLASPMFQKAGYAANETIYAGLFAGLAWFLVAVTPMLGLSSFGFHSHAERFTYLSAIGFSLVLAVTGVRLGEKAVRGFGVALAVILVVWFGLTWKEVGYWKNDKTLFLRALDVDPVNNDVAHRNLGLYYYCTEHDIPRAVEHFEQMLLRNRERNRDTQLYYIFALAESGNLARAKEETRDLDQWNEKRMQQGSMLGKDQESPKRYCILDTFLAYALIAHYEKDDELAQQHLKYVLEMNAQNEEALFIKGQIAYDNQRTQEAIQYWSACTEKKGFIVRPYLKAVLAELRKKVSYKCRGTSTFEEVSKPM